MVSYIAINLAESKSVLKMCVAKHCHEVTGFLSWMGTNCIRCVVGKGFIFSCQSMMKVS